MAEFVEVMKQARRMCTAQEDCESCPIWDTAKSFCRIGAACYSDDGVTESVVMAWAAEHPESTYPSWEDGWKQEFPNAIAVPCPRFFYDYTCEQAGDCKKCKLSPMPAEIAEKLGIKPITEPLPIMQGDFCASNAEEARKKPGLVPEHDSCEGCRYFDLAEEDEPCAHCKGTAGGLEVYRTRRDCYELKEG